MANIKNSWFQNLPSNRLIAEFSIWSSNLLNISEDLDHISQYADILHIDVADGHFAPTMLFFPDLVAAISKVSTIPIHIHLMADDSILLNQIEQFIESGANLISIHLENIKVIDRALDLINNKRVLAGLVLKNDTPVGRITKYLDKICFLTLLGTSIGIKGKGLEPNAINRLKEAKLIINSFKKNKRIILAADGGIRENTVPLLRDAGAETVVLGSLAFNSVNLSSRISWLHSL